MTRTRRRPVGWLARRVGRRGAALLFFGQLDLVIAWSLVDPVSAPLLRHAPAYRIVNHLPLEAWAAVWALVGAACLVGAVFQWADRWAFTAAIGIKLLWGLVMLAAWPLGASRGWLSGEVWLTFAGFVGLISAWPEPARRGGPNGA